MADSPSIAVIIVAYDSGRVLQRCLDCLLAQTRPADRIVVVDNNSPSSSYLDRIPASATVRIVRLPRNEGFCTANNLAYAMVRDCRHVVFLNPDAFLSARFLEEALSWMERPDNASVGCLTGTLLGFDVEHGAPTGLIDSTGIFQKWYGRWYDRGRGAPSRQLATVAAEEIPAACGALMFCKTQALEDVSLRAGEVFDPTFFMYKEDIDLSVRMRGRGWRIMYVPELLCHHVRGWQGRRFVTRQARYLSTRNELRLCVRNGGRGLPYGLAKYVYVTAIEPLLLWLQRHLTRPP
jgi:GT2 family glycosyltransferase